MKRFSKSLLVTSLALLAGAPVANADDEMEVNTYAVDLQPLNGSGVYGAVELKVVNGKTLTVEIEASGLEAGKPHPQHIHGFNKPPAVNSSCPTIENDTDGDGLVSVGEGAVAFGPILVPLAPFDTVDGAGNLHYQASFTINPSSMQPLHKRAVVLHGLTVDSAYVPSLPIACGEIVDVEDDY